MKHFSAYSGVGWSAYLDWIAFLNLNPRRDLERVAYIFNSESSPKAMAILNDDTKQLGFYGIQDWQVLQVHHSTCQLVRHAKFSNRSRIVTLQSRSLDNSGTRLKWKNSH